jgi:hypothetical protein
MTSVAAGDSVEGVDVAVVDGVECVDVAVGDGVEGMKSVTGSDVGIRIDELCPTPAIAASCQTSLLHRSHSEADSRAHYHTKEAHYHTKEAHYHTKEAQYHTKEASSASSSSSVTLPQMLSSSATWAIVIVNMVQNWGYFIYMNWMPTYFNTVRSVHLCGILPVVCYVLPMLIGTSLDRSEASCESSQRFQ